MTKEPLKKASEKLAQDCEDIIKAHPDAEKSDISNLIMARMCLETIYLPKNLVESYNTSNKVTIDPSQAKLEWELNDEEKKEYYRIRAYSFGPFNPIEYFNSKFRILWLLKEPYCKSIREINGTETKDYRQGLTYCTWDKVLNENNPTIKNAIKYTQRILKALKESGKYEQELKNEDLEDENDVMKHICILEVNHFPGLAFNGTDSNNNLLKDLGTINHEVLKVLIDFYEADLAILGGKNAMDRFIKDNYKDQISGDSHFFNWIRVSKVADFPDHEYSIFDRKILPNSDFRQVIEKTKFKEETQRAGIFQDEKGTVWFPWYQPTRQNNIF